MIRTALAAAALFLATPALACGPYGGPPVTFSDASGAELARFDMMSAAVEVKTARGWKAVDTGLWASWVEIDGEQIVVHGWSETEDRQVQRRFDRKGKRISPKRGA